ncbi:hypothetical protein GCM10010837_51030 [Aminobacter niigataensis]
MLPNRDAALANRRYTAATGADRPWTQNNLQSVERAVALVILTNSIVAIERYLAFVRRCADYRLHRFDDRLLGRIRRDFALADHTAVPALTEGRHATVRSSDRAPRRRGFPIRVHRAGGRA